MLYYFLLLDLHIILLFCFCYHILSSTHKKREEIPKHWAKELRTYKLKNLHRVTENIYRSAMPEQESQEILQKLGITHIICLYPEKENNITFPNISYTFIPMRASKPNKDAIEQCIKTIQTLTQKNKKILLHCKHGADRTGLCIAYYRIKVQNWKKDDAIAEMLEGGYGYHIFWQQGANFLKNNF